MGSATPTCKSFLKASSRPFSSCRLLSNEENLRFSFLVVVLRQCSLLEALCGLLEESQDGIRVRVGCYAYTVARAQTTRAWGG
jgi:hypothetical protein